MIEKVDEMTTRAHVLPPGGYLLHGDIMLVPNMKAPQVMFQVR